VRLALAATIVAASCRTRPEGASVAASASARAPVPPLDKSWQQDPSHPLAAGDKAPDFEGIAHTGMRVQLSSLLTDPVVLYFCDRDVAPECTAEARNFRDQWLGYHDKVAMVLGVTADDRIAHRDFATEERLPFLLVADTDGAIARAFGVAGAKGTGRRQVAFLIGKDLAISHVFAEGGAAAGRAKEVIATVQGSVSP